MKNKLGWKIPFRQVYCDTFMSWLREVVWIFFVMKVFPDSHDFGTSALLDECIEDPSIFHDQYVWFLLRARNRRRDGGSLCGENDMGYPVLKKKDGSTEERFPVQYDLTAMRRSALPIERVRRTARCEMTEQDLETPLVMYLSADHPQKVPQG